MNDSQAIDQMFDRIRINDPKIRKYELAKFDTNQAFPANSSPPTIVVDTRMALDSLVFLDRAFIEVGVQLSKDNGDAMAVPAESLKQQIIQNGWSLFKQVQILLSEKDVDTIEYPGLVAHLKHLTESSADAIRGQGAAGSYYPAEGEVPLGELSNTNDVVVGDTNVAKGVRRFKKSATHYFRLYLRDICGFASVAKPIFGAKITVKLTPETNFAQVVMGSSGSPVTKALIKSCSLVLPTVRPDNNTLTDLMNKVNSGGTIPFEFVKYNIQTQVISGTSSSYVIPNSFRRPTAVHVFMQLNSNWSTFAGDKLRGELFNLGTSRVKVDSKQYPEEAYDGKDKGYLREYQTFLSSGGFDHTDAHGNFVDYNKWLDMYPVITYDISKTRDEMSVRTNPAIIQWIATHDAPATPARAAFLLEGIESREFNSINGVLIMSSPEYAD